MRMYLLSTLVHHSPKELVNTLVRLRTIFYSAYRIKPWCKHAVFDLLKMYFNTSGLGFIAENMLVTGYRFIELDCLMLKLYSIAPNINCT